VDPQSPDRLAACREAIIGPLRNVYGVSDKVLAMALSSLDDRFHETTQLHL